jgi:hypothetical protein
MLRIADLASGDPEPNIVPHSVGKTHQFLN